MVRLRAKVTIESLYIGSRIWEIYCYQNE